MSAVSVFKGLVFDADKLTYTNSLIPIMRMNPNIYSKVRKIFEISSKDKTPVDFELGFEVKNVTDAYLLLELFQMFYYELNGKLFNPVPDHHLP